MLIVRILFCSVLIIFLAQTPALSASKKTVPTVPDITVHMRDAGYTMGDQLTMRVMFSLPEGQKIDPDSLPLIGRVRPWLDLVDLSLQQTKNKAELQLTWQLFATVEIAQALTTPAIVFKTLSNGASKTANQYQIPPQAFYYSPVLPLPPLKNMHRRANKAPPAFDTHTPMMGFTICAALLVLTSLLLAWVHDRLSWLPFNPGPMTRLARVLKPIAKQGVGLEVAQLRSIYIALNESAGVSLYPENLSPLLKNSPYFAHVEKEVTQFVEQAWQHFYAPTFAQPISSKTVYDWVVAVAVAERLSRQQQKKIKKVSGYLSP